MTDIHDNRSETPVDDADGRTPSDRVRMFLTGLAGSGRPAARIETETDPRNPFRRVYRITGPCKASVQAGIDRLFADAERTPHLAAHGRFTVPLPDGAGSYVSLGEIIILPERASQ